MDSLQTYGVRQMNVEHRGGHIARVAAGECPKGVQERHIGSLYDHSAIMSWRRLLVVYFGYWRAKRGLRTT